MAWKTLHLSAESYLHLKNRQLVIKQEEEDYVVPIEDLNVMIIDNPRTSLSVSLMSALSDAGVVLLVCNAKTHDPIGIYHPYINHSRASEVVHEQIKLKEPAKKQLWKQVVQQKIRNQGFNLGSETIFKKFRQMVSEVKSGDTSNREAYASKIYWQEFFGEDFRRSDDGDGRNKALNYGYALLRALVCRCLVGYGLHLSLGIHHKNGLNPFNLADDLIEPFRPFVDKLVLEINLTRNDSIDVEKKRKICEIFHRECKINGKKTDIKTACDFMSASFAQCVINKKKNPNLLLASFVNDD